MIVFNLIQSHFSPGRLFNRRLREPHLCRGHRRLPGEQERKRDQIAGAVRERPDVPSHPCPAEQGRGGREERQSDGIQQCT